MIKNVSIFKAFFWCAVLLLLFGCSGLQVRDTGKATEGETLFNRLKAQNHELRSFKGIGSLTISGEKINQKARCAFAANMPDKLRVEIFGFPAGAGASFSGNGKYLYYKSRVGEQFYKQRSLNGSLKKILYLPLTVKDVANLLGGRIPFLDKMYVKSLSVENKVPVLTLKARWPEKTCKIYFDKEKETVYKIERFNGTGQMVLKIETLAMQFSDGYKIPRMFKVSDGSGTFMKFRIDKFWSNVDTADSFFTLLPFK